MVWLQNLISECHGPQLNDKCLQFSCRCGILVTCTGNLEAKIWKEKNIILSRIKYKLLATIDEINTLSSILINVVMDIILRKLKYNNTIRSNTSVNNVILMWYHIVGGIWATGGSSESI